MGASEPRLEDKLAALLSLAEQRKNILDYQEIMEILGDDSLNADCIDKTFQVLEAGGVEIRLGGLYAYAFGTDPKSGYNEADDAPADVREFLEEFQDVCWFGLRLDDSMHVVACECMPWHSTSCLQSAKRRFGRCVC